MQFCVIFIMEILVGLLYLVFTAIVNLRNRQKQRLLS